MPSLEWVNDYIGIPFEDGGRTRAGCDCYGLVRLVLREQFGVDLAAYDGFYESVEDREKTKELLRVEKASTAWGAIDEKEARLGDVVVFLMKHEELRHCGIMLNAVDMLNIREGGYATVESIADPLWCNRLEGVYRYRAA